MGEDDVALICPYLYVKWRVPPAGSPHYARYTIKKIIAKGSGSVGESTVYDWFGNTGVEYVMEAPVTYPLGPDFAFVEMLSGEDRFKKHRINKDKFIFRYGFGTTDEECIAITDSFYTHKVTAGKYSSPIDKYSDIVLYRHYQDRFGLAYSTEESAYVLIDPDNYDTMEVITPPAGYTYNSVSGFDRFNGDIYFKATTSGIAASGVSTKEIVAVNPQSKFITRRMIPENQDNIAELMFGKFILSGVITFKTTMISPVIYGIFPYYLVLQRTNYDFEIVKSGFFRDRLEISNYAPMVTMDRRLSSTELYYISSDNHVTQMLNPSMSGFALNGTAGSGSLYTLGIVSEDMRYTGDDESAVESGYSLNLYTLYSGMIGKMNLDTLESMSGFYSNPSGYMTRLETSNYVYPFQNMFVSLSGYARSGVLSSAGLEEESWGFLQRESISGTWVDYSSGYPQARTTIIRYDDML